MFEIFLPKEERKRLSPDEYYLIVQTIRITNYTKILLWASIDIKDIPPYDMLKARKTEELFLAHGANLYEVLHRLGKKDKHGKTLYTRYKETLKDKSTLLELDRLMKLVRKPDKSIEVLEAIRNFHSAHIATDYDYVWQSISDEPPDIDIPVGVGESGKSSEWFVMLDRKFLFDHINKYILQKSESIHSDVYQIIKEYTRILTVLFSGIRKVLLEPLLKIKE